MFKFSSKHRPSPKNIFSWNMTFLWQPQMNYINGDQPKDITKIYKSNWWILVKIIRVGHTMLGCEEGGHVENDTVE